MRGEWEWHALSEYLPIDDIIAHPEKPWNIGDISNNRSITIKAKRRLDALDMPNDDGFWDWDDIPENVPIEDVTSYPEEKWCGFHLSMNMGITIEDVKYLDITGGRSAQGYLSMNVPIEDVRRNPELLWNRDGLSCNPDITIEDVRMIERIHPSRRTFMWGV